MSRDPNADPRAQDVIRLYTGGMPIDRVARSVGMGAGKASDIVKAAGIPMRNGRRWSPERISELKRLRDEGRSWSDISVQMGCSYGAAFAAYKASFGDLSTAATCPEPHRVIGSIRDPRPDIARRVEAEVRRLGAVVMLHHRGRIVTAIPGSRVAQAAARERAVIMTYTDDVPGFSADWIADDLSEVMP